MWRHLSSVLFLLSTFTHLAACWNPSIYYNTKWSKSSNTLVSLASSKQGDHIDNKPLDADAWQDQPSSVSKYPPPSSSAPTPSRLVQLEELQGTWLTGDGQQLVTITSSYATFHGKDASSPRILYPLGGTDNVITLRSAKLISTNPCPTWSASPCSQIQGPPTLWERCHDSEKDNLNSNSSQQTVLGFEDDMVSLGRGPLWSASPVDVIRAGMYSFQHRNPSGVFQLCRARNFMHLEDFEERVFSSSGAFRHLQESRSWSLKGCQFQSSDSVTLWVSIDSPPNSRNHSYEWKLSREKGSTGGPNPSFDSVTDFELGAHGLSWVIDSISAVRTCS